MDYILVENLLTAAPDDFRAQVTNVKSYTPDDIIDQIMSIGAGLTRSDVRSVLEAEKQVLVKIAADGGAFTTELFNVFPSVQGVFDHAGDGYDPSRHRVKINLQPGIALRDAASRIRPRKVAPVATGPQVTSVVNVKTGSMNSTVNMNFNLRISGSKLKIAGTHADVGVWFVQDNGTGVKVDPSDLVTNSPSELVIIVPTMVPGEYRLKIVTQYSSGKPLKTPQTTTFDKVLTIT